jgi:hypothetical protein
MRCLIPLLLAVCAAAGESDGYERIVAVEVYGMGASYHSNRDVDWNETNYGLGIGLAAREPGSTVEAVWMAGTYRDSFNEQAYLVQAGIRKTFGDFDGLHGTLGATIGYLKGSGNKGASFIPMVSVGYDWLDLCMVYVPSGVSGEGTTGVDEATTSSDPKDNRFTDTAVVAFLVKIRLCEF